MDLLRFAPASWWTEPRHLAHWQDMLFVCSAEGVYEKPAKFTSLDFIKLVWTLVNLHKSTRFTICIMNPWTRQEMHRLWVRLLQVSDTHSVPRVPIAGLNLDDTSTIYDMFGPITRLWIYLRDSQVKPQYESDVIKERSMIYRLPNLRKLSITLASHPFQVPRTNSLTNFTWSDGWI